jgi:hypothetical protein
MTYKHAHHINFLVSLVLSVLLFSAPTLAQYVPTWEGRPSEGYITFDPNVGLLAGDQDGETFIPEYKENYLKIFPNSPLKKISSHWNVFEGSFFFKRQHIGGRQPINNEINYLKKICLNRKTVHVPHNSVAWHQIRNLPIHSLYMQKEDLYIECSRMWIVGCPGGELRGLKCVSVFHMPNTHVLFQFTEALAPVAFHMVDDIRTLKIARLK